MPFARGSAPSEATVYDDVHNQVTQTDVEGRVTRSTADRQGRLLEVVNPLGAIKSYEYDPAANKTKESNWHDAATPRTDVLFTDDDAGRLARRDEPLGRVTEYACDAVGNTTRETLRDGADPSFAPRVVDIRYDALNRKIQEDHALGSGVVTTRFTLDGNGNKVREVDPLGRITTYRYDALNRLIEKRDRFPVQHDAGSLHLRRPILAVVGRFGDDATPVGFAQTIAHGVIDVGHDVRNGRRLVRPRDPGVR